MGTAKTILLTIATLAVAGAGVAAAMVWGGLYNVASTEQHTQVVFSALETAMRQSVRLRARDIETPALDDERMVQLGAACFRDNCVQCHGAPGVAQSNIGKSMQPVPGPLVDAGQRLRPRELYWVTRHGIKMSGMPAWEFHLADDELWATVAFLARLPDLTPQQYAAMTQFREVPSPGTPAAAPACGRLQRASAPAPAPAPAPRPDTAAAIDPARGQRALYQYACNACHTIPGVTGYAPNVGPPLTACRVDGGGRV
ncbi:MAG: cytochrome c, partial [Comamonadaceae bacterium]